VVGFNFGPEISKHGEYECILNPMLVAKTGTQEYDGAACGLMIVRRWVLEAMMIDPNLDECSWFDWWGRNSQDVVFYHRARDVGARTGVDRDNPVDHWGDKKYTMAQFYARQDRWKKAELEVGQEVNRVMRED
jgi:hypothetical protein